jgi:hypothetical protein
VERLEEGGEGPELVLVAGPHHGAHQVVESGPLQLLSNVVQELQPLVHALDRT